MIPMIALALLTQPPEILQFGPEDIDALPAAMTQVEARARRLIIDHSGDGFDRRSTGATGRAREGPTGTLS